MSVIEIFLMCYILHVLGVIVGMLIMRSYYRARRVGRVVVNIDKTTWQYHCDLEPDQDSTTCQVNGREKEFLLDVLYVYTNGE